MSGFLQKIFLKLGHAVIKFGFYNFSTVSQKKNCYMVLSHDAFTVGMFNNCAIFFSKFQSCDCAKNNSACDFWLCRFTKFAVNGRR